MYFIRIEFIYDRVPKVSRRNRNSSKSLVFYDMSMDMSESIVSKVNSWNIYRPRITIDLWGSIT